MRSLRFWVPVVAVLAVVGIAVGVVALTKKPKSYAAQFRRVRVELRQTDAQIAALKADSTVGAVNTLKNELVQAQGSITKVQNQITSYKICIPELEQQINDESIQQNTTGGYVTDAYLQDNAIISSNCTKVLNGS